MMRPKRCNCWRLSFALFTWAGAATAEAGGQCSGESIGALLGLRDIESTRCEEAIDDLRQTGNLAECSATQLCTVGSGDIGVNQHDLSRAYAETLEAALDRADHEHCNAPARFHLARIRACDGAPGGATCVPDPDGVRRVLEPLTCVTFGGNRAAELCKNGEDQIKPSRAALVALAALSADIEVDVQSTLPPSRVLLMGQRGESVELARNSATLVPPFRFRGQSPTPGDYRLYVVMADGRSTTRDVHVAQGRCAWRVDLGEPMPGRQKALTPLHPPSTPDADAASPTWWVGPSIALLSASGLAAWSAVAYARAEARTTDLGRCEGTYESCDFYARRDDIEQLDDIQRWTAYGALVTGVTGLVWGGYGWWTHRPRDRASIGISNVSLGPNHVLVSVAY